MRRLALLVMFIGSAAANPRAGFSSYRDARLLCTESVVGSGLEIEWSSYASKDDVATVVAWYEKSSGRTSTTGTKQEKHLEYDADHMLDIYPATKNDDFPHCDKKPDKSEKSVIMMSRAIRRSPAP